MKRRRAYHICAQILLTLALACGPGVYAAASAGINVASHTADEIRQYIRSSQAALDAEVSYAAAPVLTAPYQAGQLSEATLKNAVAVLNQVRYIAGLDANVTLDAAYTQTAQAGMLVNAVNKEMTHYPTQPSDMDTALFELGAEGCGSSNIALGYTTLGEAIVHGWMADDDKNNIGMVGHRRWVLNPPMGKTGFGYVNRYSSMYSFDTSNRSAAQYGVVWPAQMMPTDYFEPEYPWSVSMGRTVDQSGLKVVLTRERDGRKWEFSESGSDGYFNVNNENYGQIGCIIFRPDGVGEYYNGDVFQVDITGTGISVSYTVSFFDMVPVDSINAAAKEFTVGEGEDVACGVTVLPENSSKTVIQYEIEDETVLERWGSSFTGKKAGSTKVTASCGGKSVTFTVNVTHVYKKGWGDATCTRNGVCYYCNEVIAPALGHEPGAAATCTTPQKCTRCNEILENKLGHSYVEKVVAPTETEQGYTIHVCSRCQDEYRDTYVAPLGKPKPETEKPQTKPTETPETEKPQTKPTETPETEKPQTKPTETPETEKPQTKPTETPETEKPQTKPTETPETEKPQTKPTETKPASSKTSRNGTLSSTASTVKISWKPDAKAASGYRIYVKSGKKYVKAATVKAGVTSYTIKKINGKKLKAGTAYTVRVVSLKKTSGKIKEGRKVTITTATKPKTPSLSSLKRKSGTKAVLKWKKASGSVSGYEIQMSTSSKKGFKTVKKLSSGKTSYTKTKLSKKKTYYFRIRTYKKVTGGYVYSAWSKVKTLKK